MRWVRTTLPWVSMTVTATGTSCFSDSASTRSAMFFALVSKSMIVSPFKKWNGCSVSALSSELPHVKAESSLRVSGLLEPLLQEGFDAFLRRWPLDGGHAGVPARSDLDVG